MWIDELARSLDRQERLAKSFTNPQARILALQKIALARSEIAEKRRQR